MIEPIIGDKQCSKCGECKPLTAFGLLSKSSDGRHSHCKACRNAHAKDKVRQRRPDFRGVDRSPTAWLLPADPRPFGQQLANATQRKWRYPVEPAVNLTWRIAA